MTPAARFQTAIEILDQQAEGRPAEQLLTAWARRSRFAGSKDRAAIRDIVFDILRQRASSAAYGGGFGGRALVLGYCRKTGLDPEAVFSGQGHAPQALSDPERARGAPPPPGSADALDCPGWLLPLLANSLGSDRDAVLEYMQNRAPAFIRVNLARIDRNSAKQRLLQEGIEAEPHQLSPSALQVTARAGRIQNSEAFREGLIELQDAASQAVADLVPLQPGQRMLDYCAGGGGKTLAVGARVRGAFTLHDINPTRLKDARPRAERAGLPIQIAATKELSRLPAFDIVLADAPCSGSGAWRRSPEEKWRFSPERLSQLCQIQAEILTRAASLTTSGGRLVYATCSLLAEENDTQVEGFLGMHPDWRLEQSQHFNPLDGGDGFFCAILAAPSVSHGAA